MTFENLGLSQKVLAAVDAVGYTEPTPIQAQAIPFAVEGRDVLGIAQTGTGKTASFVLPMLTRLERGRARARMPRSLIIEPTRELAAQVAASFELYGSQHKLTVALLIGGVSFDEQNRKLDRGADVLIATPGRLLDHFERGKLLLTGVEILVIDEADRMLDMGFIPDVERISKLLPPRRQTLFFSATMPPEIQRLADTFLNHPERIEATPPATAAGTIVQRAKFCSDEPAAKREALRSLLRELDVKNAILFCNRKRDVATLHKSLVKHGFDAAALHGDMDQHQRTATLEAFRNGDVRLLVASDVAARGLDIPDVSHIFNYDVPIQPEDYVHRIGRTGRAGREGFAAMLVTPQDKRALKAITDMLGGEIEWIGAAPGHDDFDSRRGRRPARRRGERGPKPAAERSSAKPAGAKTEARKAAPQADDGNSGAKKRRKAEPANDGSRRDKEPRNKGQRDKGQRDKGQRDKGQRDKGQRKEGGERVVGMGDHVPAFLKRSPRAS